jgi:hypothetical protein
MPDLVLPDRVLSNSVFVSCVSDEFEKPDGPFAGLRSDLRRYLARAMCHVIVPEDFPQTPEDTVEKLAGIVRRSAAVIHLIGERPGAVANPKAVAAFLAKEQAFLAGHPELKADLGDFGGVSYTQWEASLALHFGVPLFVYATKNGDATQATHLKRLRLGRRYPGDQRVTVPADLLGQLIGDIHTIIAAVPKFTRQIAPSRILRHAPPILFGREKWLDALDAAWANPRLNVFTLVAWGGVGKTSLVAHWVSQRFAAQGWPGVERYFDWSFYSQGTGESRQTSSDLFIQSALTFFGDPDPIKGSPWERGERLASLIRKHRTLLVLDGIEPLQYPVNDPQAGRLRDQALEALLQGLAAANPGLCIVTTREHLKNIENQATTKEEKLDRLVKDAAVALLRHLQVVGTEEEMAAAWRDAGGHALTLQLLGRFIADAYEDRDIRHYREVKFEAADLERQGKSAFKVMVAYERWLQSAGVERQRELAVLRLTGLFDRPMSRDCLQVLRVWARPSWMRWLLSRGGRQTWRTFGKLSGLSAQELAIALKRLSDVDLVTVTPDAIDAHPLIREYFAQQLRDTQPAAFRAAHSRLFDHLCATTPHRPDTLDGLQPLYQAVVHGCLAGRHRKACNKVYIDRILRGTGEDGFYSTYMLGAVSADLGAVAAFFDEPWTRVSPNLTEPDRAWLLGDAAFSLRALGRLTEALQPLRASLDLYVRLQDWKQASIQASNLSRLGVALGRLVEAVADALQSIAHADQSGDQFQRLGRRVAAADALHQSGARAKGGALFAEAERIQREREPEFLLLYSLQGFLYCDWLLAPAERAAWRTLLGVTGDSGAGSLGGKDPAASYAEVERRATSAQTIALRNRWLLDIALDHLTLGRVGLVQALLAAPVPQPALDLPHVSDAVRGLRNAGRSDHLPKGLLTAAVYHFVRGEHDRARALLDEVQQIAERGPMPLYLADVHLQRARLFRDRAELATAADLIRELGYGRRFDELADAEAALGKE